MSLVVTHIERNKKEHLYIIETNKAVSLEVEVDFSVDRDGDLFIEYSSLEHSEKETIEDALLDWANANGIFEELRESAYWGNYHMKEDRD